MQTSIPTFPVDLTDTDNEFEENEFEENEEVDDIDDIGNDPDYIPDSKPKKPHIFKENFPRWKWEKVYRYWTRQDDYSKPIIISPYHHISREYVKTLGKQKRTEINVKSQFPNIVGDIDCNIFVNGPKKLKTVAMARLEASTSERMRVYELFCEKRDMRLSTSFKSENGAFKQKMKSTLT